MTARCSTCTRVPEKPWRCTTCGRTFCPACQAGHQRGCWDALAAVMGGAR